MTITDRYKDDVISLHIPNGYYVSERPNPFCWSIKKNIRNIMGLEITPLSSIELNKTVVDMDATVEHYTNIVPTSIVFPDYSIYYSGSIRRYNNKYSKFLCGVIYHKEYGFYFDIREPNDFEIQKYFNFFQNIRIDQVNYYRYLADLKSFQTGDISKRKSRNQIKTPIKLPQTFMADQKKRLIEEKGCIIEIYNHTEFDSECSIKLKKQQLKETLKQKNVKILSVNHKKWVIENLTGEKLDISQCKKIKITSESEKKCLSILILADTAFDLMKYQELLCDP
jgi:hypothetical protein